MTTRKRSTKKAEPKKPTSSFPKKVADHLHMPDPFTAVVTMRGGLGEVTFKDPPRSIAQAAQALADEHDGKKIFADAAVLRAYIESADDAVGLPAKGASIEDWVSVLMKLPSSQYLRLNQGVSAVTGDYDHLGN